MSAREGNVCGTCIGRGTAWQPRATRTRGRICIFCDKPICPDHLVINRCGKGYVYVCKDCDSSDLPYHRYENALDEQQYVARCASVTTRCAKCKESKVDPNWDDDLCERCRNRKCVHCHEYDLDRSFDYGTCRQCKERVCEDHSKLVFPDRDGCTLYIECRECVDLSE